MQPYFPLPSLTEDALRVYLPNFDPSLDPQVGEWVMVTPMRRAALLDPLIEAWEAGNEPSLSPRRYTLAEYAGWDPRPPPSDVPSEELLHVEDISSQASQLVEAEDYYLLLPTEEEAPVELVPAVPPTDSDDEGCSGVPQDGAPSPPLSTLVPAAPNGSPPDTVPPSTVKRRTRRKPPHDGGSGVLPTSVIEGEALAGWSLAPLSQVRALLCRRKRRRGPEGGTSRRGISLYLHIRLGLLTAAPPIEFGGGREVKDPDRGELVCNEVLAHFASGVGSEGMIRGWVSFPLNDQENLTLRREISCGGTNADVGVQREEELEFDWEWLRETEEGASKEWAQVMEKEERWCGLPNTHRRGRLEQATQGVTTARDRTASGKKVVSSAEVFIPPQFPRTLMSLMRLYTTFPDELSGV